MYVRSRLQEVPCDIMRLLSKLVASMYGIQCTFTPRSRKAMLIEQMCALEHMSGMHTRKPWRYTL